MKKFIFCFSLLTLFISPFTFVFAQSDQAIPSEVSKFYYISTKTSVPTPIGGECPGNYVISADGKYCIPSSLSPIEIIPTLVSSECPEEYIVSDDGNSCIKLVVETFLPIPVDGECPEEYVVSPDGEYCANLSLPAIEITPIIGVEPVVEGQGSFIITPTNGECPDNYIVSVDDKYCIKPSLPTIEIAPTVGVKPIVSESGAFMITPVDGKCPDGYIVSDDGKQCVKPAIPTIFIAPMESTKEVIFEPVTDEIIIKDKNTQQEARIAPQQGFKVVVSVESDEDQPTKISKNITIESKTGSGTIIISVKEVFAVTKEPIQVRENKIFLKQKEIKIMPDTASEIAIEKLKSLDIEIELKDVGRQDVVKPVYEVVGIKEVKILGLFKVKMKVRTEIDAETGNVGKIKKPWWSFLAR